jgi:hypothetical protein
MIPIWSPKTAHAEGTFVSPGQSNECAASYRKFAADAALPVNQ